MSAVVREAAISTRPVDAALAPPRSARSRAAAAELVINLCALCRTPEAQMLFHLDRGVIVQCPRCDLVRDATRPSSPGAVYDQEYYAGDDPQGGYVFNRLRYYAPAIFGSLEQVGRTLGVGPFPFRLYVGEMEAWAAHGDLRRRS